MFVPELARQVADPVVLEHRGVVDQHRQGAERGDGCGDQALDLILVGQVGLERYGAATERAHGVCDSLGLFGVAAVVDGDVMAGLGQRETDRLSDAFAASGDEGGAGLSQPGRTR